MTSAESVIKYGQFVTFAGERGGPIRIMNSTRHIPTANQPPFYTEMEKMCRHPRVRVVAREEDAEFVECQECGDVFDSSEFKDMAIEEDIEPQDEA